MTVKSRFTFAIAILIAFTTTTRAQNFWGDWPKDADPKVVGKRIAQNLVDRPTYMVGVRGGLSYPEVCTAYGSMRFADATGDKELLDKLVARYAMIVTDNPNTPDGKRIVQNPVNVDSSVFGIVPFEIYLMIHDEKFMELGKKSADAQWAKPPQKDPPTTQMTNFDAGLTPQTRFWIDDMFMVTSLQVQAYRATKDKTYLDRGAHEMVAYLDKLQQPSGLFYHGEVRQLLLGPRRWMGGGGDGRVAPHHARGSSRSPAHRRGIQEDDGGPSEESGREGNVASVDR